jgi:riboflavin synthase
MFTGIVQHLGRIASFEPNPFGAAIHVDSTGWAYVPQIGDSIAVNGCCLTVAGISAAERVLKFDVVRQTLQLTTLSRLQPGDLVNLEHPVAPQALLGGQESARRIPPDHRTV